MGATIFTTTAVTLNEYVEDYVQGSFKVKMDHFDPVVK